MSAIVRKIASSPKRTAVEVWETICKMISDQSSDTIKVLESVTGISSAIISDEIPKDTPIILVGKGPRVRIYCVYGEDALSEDNCNEYSLIQKPTSGNWHMYLPCNQEDMPWLTEALSIISDSITVYDKEKELNVEKQPEEPKGLTIDPSSFLDKL